MKTGENWRKSDTNLLLWELRSRLRCPAIKADGMRRLHCPAIKADGMRTAESRFPGLTDLRTNTSVLDTIQWDYRCKEYSKIEKQVTF